MHIIRHDDSTTERANAPIFVGDVGRRGLVGAEQSDTVTVGLIEFEAGGRNKLHTHTFDQVLYITKGEGIVATELEEHRVRPGDVAVINAGEKHWHGAGQHSAMSHLAIGTPGTTEIVGE